MKSLAFLFAASVLTVVGSGCLNPVPECGPKSCGGCCDAKHVCQTGLLASSCGTAGGECSECSLGQSCSTAGACVLNGGTGGGSATGGGPVTGGGTTGGGSDGGGPSGGGSTGGGDVGGGSVTGGGSTGGGDVGGGSVTGGGSTGGGSVTGGGSTGGGSTGGGSTGGGSTGGGSVTGGGSTGGGSVTGGGSTGGGSTGGGAASCNAGNCLGCCNGTTCVTIALETASSCGTGAAMCMACNSGDLCQNGVCVTPTGCSPTTCAGGCCLGPLCLPPSMQNTGACGINGASCQGCSSGASCTNGQCTSVGACNSTTCPSGCCSGNLCVPFGSQSSGQCGTGGATCGGCSNNNSCMNGVCVAAANCDFFSCAGCCVNNTCTMASAQTNSSCGLNGVQCGTCQNSSSCNSGVCTGGTVCNATNCNGCCNGNTCITNRTAATCGQLGSACVSCGPGQTCSSGTCVSDVSPNCVVITPNSFDFGTVQTSCRSAVTQFHLRNVCATQININAIGAVGGTGFSLGGLPSFPVALNPAGTMNFTATFAPTAVGPTSSTLVVGATQSTMSVAYQTRLDGTGASSGANVETFTVPTKADVLLVVDNSCSMSDKQAAVASNANALLAYAISAGIDFNLGFTTTDDDSGGEQGRFLVVNNMSVIKNTTPNLLTAFGAFVQPGVNGSGTESMFSPAVKALTPPLIASTNANFLRADSTLAVLALTDANEQSSQPTDYYVDSLRNIRGWRNRNRVSFSFIGPTLNAAPSGCSYDGLSADPREFAMTAATGGVMTEVCDVLNQSVWRPKALALGQQVFGARATWFLTAVPVPAAASGLTVSIAGNTIPEVGTVRNWSYDAARNAVVFEANSLPAPGQSVRFAYSVACMP